MNIYAHPSKVGNIIIVFDFIREEIEALKSTWLTPLKADGAVGI